MKKIIKAILLFLIPILKNAFIKAAADELTKLAYPPRQPLRRDTSRYDRMSQEQPRYSSFVGNGGNGGRPRPPMPADKYHDVVSLVVDITGPNQALIQEFILSRGVRPGLFMHEGEQFDVRNVEIVKDEKGTDI